MRISGARKLASNRAIEFIYLNAYGVHTLGPLSSLIHGIHLSAYLNARFSRLQFGNYWTRGSEEPSREKSLPESVNVSLLTKVFILFTETSAVSGAWISVIDRGKSYLRLLLASPLRSCVDLSGHSQDST